MTDCDDKKNTDGILHEGRVVGYGKNTLLVQLIMEAGECDGCEMARNCGKAQVVKVPYYRADRKALGAKVRVRVTKSYLGEVLGCIPCIACLILIPLLVLKLGASGGWAVASGFIAMSLWIIVGNSFGYFKAQYDLADDE